MEPRSQLIPGEEQVDRDRYDQDEGEKPGSA